MSKIGIGERRSVKAIIPASFLFYLRFCGINLCKESKGNWQDLNYEEQE